MSNIDYKKRFPHDQVMQATYESNVRRFAQMLGVGEMVQNTWYHNSVEFMPVVRKDSVLYVFWDKTMDESAIMNEHGVCVFKDFNTVGEFV